MATTMARRSRTLAAWLLALAAVLWLGACSVSSDDFGKGPNPADPQGRPSVVQQPKDQEAFEGGAAVFEMGFRLPETVRGFELQAYLCEPLPSETCSTVARNRFRVVTEGCNTATYCLDHLVIESESSSPGFFMNVAFAGGDQRLVTYENRMESTIAVLRATPALDGHRVGANLSYWGEIAGSLTTKLAKLTVRPAPFGVAVGPSSDVRLRIGEAETLYAVASFPTTDPEPTYQWQLGGVDIPGANARRYRVDATAADAGTVRRYRVVATRGDGSGQQATSDEALVTVLNELAPPTIVVQPSDVTVADGSPAGFAVFARGAALTYQWYRDGQPIAGATEPEYRLGSATRDDDGARFSVRVGNAAGQEDSEPATLTVLDAPELVGLRRYAGVLGGAGNADGRARSLARFDTPMGVVRDSFGNVYVADTLNGVVRRIGSDGQVSVLAGSVLEKGHLDGPGSLARFTAPVALAMHGDSLYVADWNHTIRRIQSPSGPMPLVTTVAGRPNEPGAADGVGDAARFNGPSGLAIGPDGALYVSDIESHTIRRIDLTTREVTTFAGRAFTPGSAGGARLDARFRHPRGIFVGGQRLLVADSGNHTVRSIALGAAGEVVTLIGQPGVAGMVNGSIDQARLSSPTGVVDLGFDRICIADSGNHAIRQFTNGALRTIAGVGIAGESDGLTGSEARFNVPIGLAVGGAEELLVADTLNHAVRTVLLTSPGLLVGTRAGQKPVRGATDGFWSIARFDSPAGVAADLSGALWIADTGNHVLRRLANDRVSTPVGAAGARGTQDGSGGDARFDAPTAVAVDGTGELWVAQERAVRRVSGSAVTTLAFGGLLDKPASIALGPGGAAYVADRGTHRILRVGADGSVVSIAGDGTAGHADGTGPGARFNEPAGIVYDPATDTLVVADLRNHVLRRVSLAGAVTTIAGAAGQAGHADGSGSAARLREPAAVALGFNGNLYVADRGNHVLRKVTTAGAVTTIAGRPGIAGFEDGSLPGLLARPAGIAVYGASIFVTLQHGIVELRGPGLW